MIMYAQYNAVGGMNIIRTVSVRRGLGYVLEIDAEQGDDPHHITSQIESNFAAHELVAYATSAVHDIARLSKD